jgi:hypothetical protein
MLQDSQLAINGVQAIRSVPWLLLRITEFMQFSRAAMPQNCYSMGRTYRCEQHAISAVLWCDSHLLLAEQRPQRHTRHLDHLHVCK